jgi:hypothetical protein
MKSIFIIFSLIVFTSCKDENKSISVNPNKIKEPLININKSKVEMENEQNRCIH